MLVGGGWVGWLVGRYTVGAHTQTRLVVCGGWSLGVGVGGGVGAAGADRDSGYLPCPG